MAGEDSHLSQIRSLLTTTSGLLTTTTTLLTSILGNDPEGYPITLTAAHHKIHEGNHYYYTDSVVLGSAASQTYMLLTPPAVSGIRLHMLFDVTGTSNVTLGVYESADRDGTTLQTIYNSYRESTNSSLATLYKGTSGGTTDGTNIFPVQAGSVQRAGAISREDEIILLPSTKYIFKVTSGGASNVITTHLIWYETAFVS